MDREIIKSVKQHVISRTAAKNETNLEKRIDDLERKLDQILSKLG